MNRLLRINFVPLFMDAGLVLYALLFHDSVGGNQGKMHPLLAYAFIFIMQTTLPLFMRKLTVAYRPLEEKRGGGFLVGLMKFFHPLTYFWLFVMCGAIIKVADVEPGPATVPLLMFGAIYAMFHGYFMGESLANEENEDMPDRTVRLVRQSFNWTAVFGGYLGLAGGATGVFSAPVALVMVAGSVTGSVFAKQWLVGQPGIQERGSEFRKRLARAGEFILALLVVTALGFLFKLSTFMCPIRPGAGIIPSLFPLLVTGFLPLRIFAEFEPPSTPLSLVTGSISIGLFLFRFAG